MSKAKIRLKALAARDAVLDKDRYSSVIQGKLNSLPEFLAASTVLFYVDVRSEVRTREAIRDALLQGKKVVVPFCLTGELGLFYLDSMDELESGAYAILEPRTELRENRDKICSPEAIDLVIVPGIAFDARGGRIGYGRGYYDRLLVRLRSAVPTVALAYDCQVLPNELPLDGRDILMDKIVTEKQIYNCK